MQSIDPQPKNLRYDRTFDPQVTQVFAQNVKASTKASDWQARSIYVYNEEIVLAVNIALATGRPLLVRGPSGCGKSSLAHNVSKVLGWRYYEKVITSRTQARDLLWEVDLLRRLQDAQARQLQPDFTPYIIPGVLWWAFDPKSARQRGAAPKRKLDTPQPEEPGEGGDHPQAVVLLDEIDKADPDVPNNLLVPLGSLRFRVDETGTEVRARKAPLIFLSTNDERDLPAAFLRRCVELVLKKPNKEELVAIGTAHFKKQHIPLLEKVASLIAKASSGNGSPDQWSPSTAEYLDTVRACLKLKVKPQSDVWDMLSKVTVWKHGRAPREMI